MVDYTMFKYTLLVLLFFFAYTQAWRTGGITQRANEMLPSPRVGGGRPVVQMNAVIGNPAQWPRPKKTLIIYEYESSPFSRKVRQAVSQLDLTVEYRPCPGARYGFSDQLAGRTAVFGLGGSRQVPFMNDPGNPVGTLANIKDSDEIVEYLFTNFGPGKDKIPGSLKGPFAGKKFGGADVSKPLANWREDNIFKRPLDLWGFEDGPSTPVRETLNLLCLAHRVINCSKGSANLAALASKNGGKVPYLEDPNTGKKLSGANEIKSYLLSTYTKT